LGIYEGKILDHLAPKPEFPDLMPELPASISQLLDSGS